MQFGMANLRPDETGVSVHIHVYKNAERRARHAPRVKVFPGKPHEGDATIVSIPLQADEPAEPLNRSTVSGRTLKQVLRFVERNWVWLLMYWYNPDFDETDLREHLNP